MFKLIQAFFSNKSNKTIPSTHTPPKEDKQFLTHTHRVHIEQKRKP